MEKYKAKRNVEVFDIGIFDKGTEWEGEQYEKDGWKIRLEGTENFYYFSKKAMEKFFEKR